MRQHLCVVAVLAGSLLQAQVATKPPLPLARVRPIDSYARDLLLDAWRSSVTVRALIATLEESDLFVQVEAAKFSSRRGRLYFLSGTRECRWLRVCVRVPGLRQDVLPVLAHELQHAVEIAQAPEARDAQALEALMRRIGWCRGGRLFETGAALAIEARVRLELTRPSTHAPRFP